jgi:hypothetical protein
VLLLLALAKASFLNFLLTSSPHIRSPCCITVSRIFPNFRQHFLKNVYHNIENNYYVPMDFVISQVTTLQAGFIIIVVAYVFAFVAWHALKCFD